MEEIWKKGYEELIHLFTRDFPALAALAESAETPALFMAAWRRAPEEYTPGSDGRFPLPGSRNPSGLAAAQLLRLFEYENSRCTDAATGEAFSLTTLTGLWQALRGEERSVSADFLADIYALLKQLKTADFPVVDLSCQQRWSARWPSGLDADVAAERQENRERIFRLLAEKIERQGKIGVRYYFEPGLDAGEKLERVRKWWFDHLFHLQLAIRDPDELNLFLDRTLSVETMQTLHEAKRKKIPFFITPYYLSLLSVRPEGYNDEAIRCYMLYSRELVEEFGRIRAWEKEDEVVAGQPNAAGWLLPNDHNIHRRYPDVAIFIPDSMGRACGGLCSLCQRMYDFQNGHLNFDLEALKPTAAWSDKLENLVRYYERDSQLCDILITGGDSLMSRDTTLEEILDALYRMAVRKREANHTRKVGAKFAEIQRVRLGTRLPVYLPYRITDSLIAVLRRFREKAEKIGIRQFFIQTHFESPLEVTEEVVRAVQKLQSAGWLVTNQLVFTVAASRRGHAASLRAVLNRAGIIPYYTFSVKGFRENYALFAPNSRALQERVEEKCRGTLTRSMEKELSAMLEKPVQLGSRMTQWLEERGKPFAATDRSVLNLPGIGKSMTFTTVGLTPDGRRILAFSLDNDRRHSPALDAHGPVYIIENKSLSAYLRQLEALGEDPRDYRTLWIYTSGVTERRLSIFRYPENNCGEQTPFFTHILPA